jgi:hypothetical protein
MARVKWVHERLDRWVAWRVSDQRGGRGYPKKCPMFREVKQNGYQERLVPLIEEEESNTNDAVESMRCGHVELYGTVMIHYVDTPRTLREQALVLRCSESAIRARLERIDAYIVQWLSDHKKS